MCKCNVIGCRYSEFLGDDSIYYVKDDDTCEEFCLFHIPEKIKDNVLASQKNLLKDKIVEYIEYIKKAKDLKTIDFSSCVFYYDFPSKALRDKDFGDYTFDFSHTIFYKYFSIKNIKCETLKFKDTEFLEGGAIKNRGSSKSLEIKNLIFRPFRLDADFVIDLGRYVNKEYTEEDSYGVIDDIVFENHKLGSGRVHFIGLNDKMTQADFRNRILDNVSFQNCDLSKCYFLNAKVNKTEFRNCEFPHMHQGVSINIVDEKPWSDILSIFIGFILIAILYGLSSGSMNNYFNEEIMNNIYKLLQGFYWLLPFIVIMFLVVIIKTIYFIEWLLSSSISENKFQFINKIKTLHHHKAIADEILLSGKLFFTTSEKNRKKLQETIASLESVYKQLKINFSKKDFQLSGDFFFSQRLMEIYGAKYKDNLIERNILIIHYGLNGFGEKFIKTIIFFLATLFIFATLYEPNKDFIATDVTPKFLVIDTLEINTSLPSYKKQIFQELNSSIKEKKYIPEEINNKWITRFMYSASQFISPFTSKNRAWFKTVSQKASILNLVEMVLLYLFFGAFILAVKNRIKR